jgi:serine/threonine protein kinase
MIIYCPNYRCKQRSQLHETVTCNCCGTSLAIGNKYKLTKIIRTSPNKINSPECCWSEIFESQDDSGQEILIKILVIVPEALDVPSNAENISNVKRRFEREYQLLTKGIPGVCRGYEVLDLPLEGGVVMMRAIMMEKVAGINLDEYMRTYGAIDSQRAIRWLKQLIKTLSKIHDHQVQHRDIKPSNIMVSGRGSNEQLTLIDFGIALDLSDGNTTEIFGTKDYIDPLYITSGKYQNYSDFYSLGKTFIYLLTGQIIQNDWDEDRNIAHPPIDLKLKIAIQRMTADNVNPRFKNAGQVLRYLKDKYYLSNLLKLTIFAVMGLIAFLTLSYYLRFHPPNKPPEFVHSICEISDINCGDRTSTGIGIREAFSGLSNPDPSIRKNAVQVYENKWTEQHGKAQGSELLIYLNNANVQAENNDQQKIFTMLVVVPDYTKQIGVKANILSGVAQIQKDFNDKKSNLKLYVAILTESSDENQKSPILKRRINEVIEKNNQNQEKSRFIGVIGHYSSQITFSMLNLYAKNEILLISPGATGTGIPNNTVTLKDLEYFGRTIANAQSQASEVFNFIKQLTKKNENSCGLLDIYLSYQRDDFASNSLSLEIRKSFSLMNNVQVQEGLNYDFQSTILDVKKETNKIVSNLREKLISGKNQNNKSYNDKKCTPKQVVIFLPGPHTVHDPTILIQKVAKIIPNDVDFVGNITTSILSESEVQKEINADNPDFYSKAYFVNPYSILDFLPSYFSSSGKENIDVDFIKGLMADNKFSDLLQVDWRHISSADATRIFTQAIKEYQEKEDQYKGHKISKAIRDIIKNPDFVAVGVSGSIKFNGYERQEAKTATILKYIPHLNSKKMVAVPVGYRDPSDLSKEAKEYRPLTFNDLKPLNNQ